MVTSGDQFEFPVERDDSNDKRTRPGAVLKRGEGRIHLLRLQEARIEETRVSGKES